MKLKFSILSCLILGGSQLLADTPPPATPAEAYTHIAAQLKAGEVEKALTSMTPKAGQEFINYAVEGVAGAVAFDEEIPGELADGRKVTATPASIGFDKKNFPAWFLVRKGPVPSQEQLKGFLGELTGLIDKSEDRNKALSDLLMMSDAIEAAEFGGEILPRTPDADYPKETVWIAINHSSDNIEKLALKFKKVEDSWCYSGFDWDTMEAEEQKFAEKKDLKISGKSVDGKVLSLADLKGKVVLIDFWGTW